MAKLKWWQYLSVGSFVAGWISRSLIDKKITRAELNELIQGILDMLDIDEIVIED
jgi:hypothetical protein